MPLLHKLWCWINIYTMSGHSKWSTIKRQKGLTDVKRGQTFTKLANAITIAAKSGGSGDPQFNPRLRVVLGHARSVNMPKDNIERAIDRGLGRLPGQVLEEVFYEGFGPGKIAFLIEAVTDNKTRTTQEIRNHLERSGGALGAPGSTAYLFERVGEIKLLAKPGISTDDQTLGLIDTGAIDIEDYTEEDQTYLLIYCSPEELTQLSTNITQLGYQVQSADLIYKPNLYITVSDPAVQERLFALAGKIEDQDDVQKVYLNFQG